MRDEPEMSATIRPAYTMWPLYNSRFRDVIDLWG